MSWGRAGETVGEGDRSSYVGHVRVMVSGRHTHEDV